MKHFRLPPLPIDTVAGKCPYCNEDTFLFALDKNFYRCANCGEDTKQYVNGHIAYLRINQDEATWLKKQTKESQAS